MLTLRSRLVPFVLACSLAGSAWAQCPENLCDCIDSAANFAVIAGAAKFAPGSYAEDGDLTVAGTYVEGSACVASAGLRGRIDGDGELGEDLVCRATRGVAARFRAYKEDGDPTPGFAVDGDVVTAGGRVRGVEGVDYDLFGTLAFDGNEPRVAACNQAVLDISTAGANLTALTPVQETFDSYIVDENRTIAAGAGVHVVNIAGDLRINNYKTTIGFQLGRTLDISTAVDTDAVVINVGGNLILADDANLLADTPEIVVINLTKPKSKVIIGKRATIEVPVLAPTSAVLAQAEASTANIWTTRKMTLQGASVSDALFCDTTGEPPAKTVFVTSDELDGATLGGLAGADALCQQAASDALLSGTYKAWLSDGATVAASRLSHALVPYVLTDGTLVANDWNDLVDGALTHAIDQDEDGIDLDPLFDNLQVWTATTPSGAGSSPSCLNWSTADDLEEGGIGDATSMSAAWTADDTTTCDDFARLYCIEQ